MKKGTREVRAAVTRPGVVSRSQDTTSWGFFERKKLLLFFCFRAQTRGPEKVEKPEEKKKLQG